jgi:pteridine reductase
MPNHFMRHPKPVALVTGAASFLGKAICLKLAREGYDLILHYQSSLGKTRKLEKEAKRSGAAVLLVKADLRRVEKVPVFVRTVMKGFKQLDLLVNNASLFFPTPLSKGRVDQWRELFNVNLFSPYFLAKESAPWLRRTQGCVVNLTDIYGENPILKDYAGYSASKAGLLLITKSLASELGPLVRVNGVSPGAISIPSAYTPRQKKALIGRSALKRQGAPEDIAEAVYFLATQRFITGEVLKVDGGRFF